MSEQEGSVDQNLFAVLMAEGIEPAIHFAERRIIQDLANKGVEKKPELAGFIMTSAREEVRRLTMELRKLSLAPGLTKLFEFKTKKEAERFAENELTIQQSEFANLIANAHLYGFNHSTKRKEFVPEELQNFDPMKFGEHDPITKRLTKQGQKSFNIIKEIFDKRRQLHVHFFQSEYEWHCFYFDFQDLLSQHWAGGDHIHYLSHLWGVSSQVIWDGFENRNFSPKKAHIKYVHNLRERR